MTTSARSGDGLPPRDEPRPDPDAAGESGTPHRRRPRYKGTYPRAFAEKYKELDPERFPELVEHVRARGNTPAGQHVSILVEEVLGALAPVPGERGVDATLGYGGHAQHLLERIRPGGALLGLDVDPRELPRTTDRLRKLGHDESALITLRTNFAGLSRAIGEVGWHEGVDFVFADLGVSSMQIDDPARGFTFKAEGPLDMRMNPARGLSAAQWLARAMPDELARVLLDNADEPRSALIARALCARTADGRPRGWATTRALADAVRGALPASVGEDEADSTVRRVFQALRIAVNDEFGALDNLLRQLPGCVRSGGRIALLTFHSGEDRRVKRAFEQGRKDGIYADSNDDVVRASPEERRANPRSSSAKLRWARRA